MRQVQKVACVNNAGFVMNFSIQWLDDEGHWHTSKWNSGNYPIDQHRVSPDLRSIGVPDDAVGMTPYVHAIWGTHEQGTPLVQYAAENQVATYAVTGTTLIFSVKVIS